MIILGFYTKEGNKVEGNKVCKFYSYLKLMIKAHLHVGFFTKFYAKGASSGLRQFVATEISLKMMKNAVYFTSKSFFISIFD